MRGTSLVQKKNNWNTSGNYMQHFFFSYLFILGVVDVYSTKVISEDPKVGCPLFSFSPISLITHGNKFSSPGGILK